MGSRGTGWNLSIEQKKINMSNKLKAITTKAKQLYKTGKFAKWTDAIKAASKGIGATKKTAPKKAAPKKAAPKKSSSYHKDTKSHNVNIKVVSGALKFDNTTVTFYNKLKEEIAQREEVLHNVTVVRKNDLIRANGKAWFNKWVREAKNHIKAQKKLLIQVKKSI